MSRLSAALAAALLGSCGWTDPPPPPPPPKPGAPTEGAAPPEAPATPPPRDAPGDGVQLDLLDTPLAHVLETVAPITGEPPWALQGSVELTLRTATALPPATVSPVLRATVGAFGCRVQANSPAVSADCRDRGDEPAVGCVAWGSDAPDGVPGRVEAALPDGVVLACATDANAWRALQARVP